MTAYIDSLKLLDKVSMKELYRYPVYINPGIGNVHTHHYGIWALLEEYVAYMYEYNADVDLYSTLDSAHYTSSFNSYFQHCAGSRSGVKEMKLYIYLMLEVYRQKSIPLSAKEVDIIEQILKYVDDRVNVLDQRINNYRDSYCQRQQVTLPHIASLLNNPVIEALLLDIESKKRGCKSN